MSAVAALLAITALAAPAAAVDATKPAPCAGVLLTDPAGDQVYEPGAGALFGVPGTESSPENMDIKGLFFNFKDGKLTANIQVANLTKDVPPPPESNGGVYYYVIYAFGDAVKFVAAHNTDGSTINYEYGTIDPDLGTYTTDGETHGALFEGPDGVVQLEVPADIGGKAGDVLTGAMVSIDGIDVGTDHGNGVNNSADRAPDDSSPLAPAGKNYTVTACPADGAPAPAPTPDPGTGGGGTGGGGTGGGGSTAPPADGNPSDTVLPVRFTSGLGSAKKAKKGKSVVLKAQADKPISKLVVALKKNGGKGPTLAAGKVASVKAGAFKVKLKFKRKLKKGVYTLIATGTVDGKKLQVGQRVGLK